MRVIFKLILYFAAIVFIGAFIAIFSGSVGPRVIYNDDGILEARGSYSKSESFFSKKTGLWEYFYETGKLQRRGNYSVGQQDGLWEGFHENGQLSARENYNNGSLTGAWEMFHENGQLHIRAFRSFGELDGLAEYFNENGRRIGSGRYHEGDLVEGMSVVCAYVFDEEIAALLMCP